MTHPDDPTMYNAPTWNPPTPPPPQRNWMWVVIAATVVIVIASVVTIVVAKSGDDDSTAATSTSTSSSKTSATKASVPKSTSPTSTAPQAPPPPVPLAPAALPQLLLNPAEVNALFRTSGLIDKGSASDLVGGESPIPAECRGVWATPYQGTFESSGYTGVLRDTVGENPSVSTALVQAVLTFPDDQAARAAVDKAVATWRGCESLEFTEGFGGRNRSWKTASVTDRSGVFTLQIYSSAYLQDPATTTEPNCQRAITARRNVVVDLLACNPQVGDQVVSMANDIVRKIDAAS